MDFLLSEDLVEFNKVVRAFLETEAAPAFRRSHLPGRPIADGQKAAGTESPQY